MTKTDRKIDLQNLPACAAEFIKLIIKKMRYRKKVRTDVQTELAAHLEDELKDCRTDEEKEQKVQQIINDFGDVKLLGILLRRAKKRCRPLWRTIVARTFQTVGILILCFVVYVVWFLTGKPAITTNYLAKLNSIIRPVADESLNAAPFYIEATAVCEQWPDDITRFLGEKYTDVTEEQKQLIEKFLEDNNEAFERVIAGSRKPYYWQKYEEDKGVEGMISIFMPNLAEFRRLASGLRWRAHLRAEQGRYEDAFGDMRACYRFGRHLRGDKTLIEQLVGIAIEALAAQTIRDIISQYQTDSATLAKLQKDFEQMIAGEDFVVSLKAEKLLVYDEIQRCFTEDRFGGGHLCFEGLNQLASLEGPIPFEMLFERIGWTAPLHILFTHPNKQETKEMVERLYALFDEMSCKSPARIRAENIDIEKQAMEIVEGNILLEMFTPAIGRVIELSHRNKIGVEATLPILAILRYKQDVGDYPENLDELIEAGLLKALPVDPYSAQPLVYRRTKDNFILYSLGADFDDDSGVRSKWGEGGEGGDQVFWPVGK